MKSKIIFHRDGSREYFLDDEPVSEAEYRRRRKRPKGAPGVPGITKAYSRPLLSSALGVCPVQAAAENAELERIGAKGVHYLPDGRAQFETREARKRELRRVQALDRDAFYGG